MTLRNCCTFSNEFCFRLGVGEVPKWVCSWAAGLATLRDAARATVVRARNAGERLKKGLAIGNAAPVAVICTMLAAFIMCSLWNKSNIDKEMKESR